jgi:hypothetical protein
MTKRIASLIVAALAVGAPLSAQTMPYGPGTFHYRIVAENQVKQEVMGQTQDIKSVVTQSVTLTISPGSAGALNFSVSLDSVSVDSTMTGASAAQQQLETMLGKSVSGTVSPSGEVLTFQSPDTLDVAGSAQWSQFRQLFVRMPAGGEKGSAITDTTNNTFSAQGLEVHQSVVVTSTLAADTVISGKKAWRLERAGSLAVNGKGEQQGNEMVMDGHGTINGSALIAENGLLRSTSTNDAQLTVELPAMSMSIPITQTSKSTIERVGEK